MENYTLDTTRRKGFESVILRDGNFSGGIEKNVEKFKTPSTRNRSRLDVAMVSRTSGMLIRKFAVEVEHARDHE